MCVITPGSDEYTTLTQSRSINLIFRYLIPSVRWLQKEYQCNASHSNLIKCYTIIY